MDGGDITFAEVMDLIDKYYESQILEFKNGDIVNQPGENEGSAKVFSYAALSELDKENTLKLFGEHYRSVKANPDGDDHQNIRNFMKYGWEGRWQIETKRLLTMIHVPRVCLTYHDHACYHIIYVSTHRTSFRKRYCSYAKECWRKRMGLGCVSVL